MYGFHKQRQHLNCHFFVHEHFHKGVLEDGARNMVQIEIRRKPEKKKKIEEKNKIVEDSDLIIKFDDCEEEGSRSVSIIVEDSKGVDEFKGEKRKGSKEL